jgi:hypothetical protein
LRPPGGTEIIFTMTIPNTPVPAPLADPAEPLKSEGVLGKLIDRLPAEISPAWFLGGLLILALAVIGVAWVAGWLIAALGGGLGLAGLIMALRKNP